MRPVLFLLLAGCASQDLLARDYSALQQEVVTAHQSKNCAPRDLALADANLEFAKIEFEQGDARRGAEHVRLAREHVKLAIACGGAPPPSVPTPTTQPPIATAPTTRPASTPVATQPTEPTSSPWSTPSTPATTAPVAAVADSDRDGVKDGEDLCVSSPEDLDGFKDADGCPDLDDDGDGVPDSADRCPRVAEDRDNVDDADGCPDIDNDRDGLADTADQCPNEPGSPPSGCPVRDRDRDGIADASDACPDQPETMNGITDTDGCPDAAAPVAVAATSSRIEVTGDQIVIKQRINFSPGKATILPDSYPVLDDVAAALKSNPQIRVEIGGHTDNQGDDTVNQRLSKDRADAVFEYLLAKGVPAMRMSTMGYGETRPIDTNMTESGRNNNRRVEFVIQK